MLTGLHFANLRGRWRKSLQLEGTVRGLFSLSQRAPPIGLSICLDWRLDIQLSLLHRTQAEGRLPVVPPFLMQPLKFRQPQQTNFIAHKIEKSHPLCKLLFWIWVAYCWRTRTKQTDSIWRCRNCRLWKLIVWPNKHKKKELVSFFNVYLKLTVASCREPQGRDFVIDWNTELIFFIALIRTVQHWFFHCYSKKLLTPVQTEQTSAKILKKQYS